jgi:aminoglycoside phosphotransferase (APT) family kinase protein
MDRLIEWLPCNTPDQAAVTIVHGDYRLDNLIIHPTEPRVNVVLDWELSTTGDPAADFAYHVMAWRISPDVFRGLGGVDLTKLGIPNEENYVERYCERTGRDVAKHWDFYMAYSMFRIAAIIQGIAKRALDGNAVGDDAVRVGRAAAPIAAQAWEVAQKAGR